MLKLPQGFHLEDFWEAKNCLSKERKGYVCRFLNNNNVSKKEIEEEKNQAILLPAEIRLLILEALIQDGCSLASLAAVSRDWQATVERHNFARIRLTPSRLPHFGSVVYHRRAFVRYIWVCLELEKFDYIYDSRLRTQTGDWEMDNIIMITALDDLFSALSKWEPQGDLLLDISAHSPSDSEYHFKELTFVPDFPSSMECDRALAGTAEAKLARIANDKNPDHVWTGAPGQSAIGSAFTRLMQGAPFEPPEQQREWWRLRPRAPAVTGLLLRQQNRRRWNPGHPAWLIARLPGVRRVHYEPWREWADVHQEITDQKYKSLFDDLSSCFKRLERLVLFENFDQRYLPGLRHCQSLRIPRRDVGLALARASRGLKHLSAAFMVEAVHFLNAATGNPEWKWPKLTSLALTSRLLQPSMEANYSDSVLEMLKSAATAAKSMTSLETMEIWYGVAGVAGMFRYRSARRGQTASITWRGTWDLELGEDVIRAWEAVTNMERRGGLVVVKDELLDASKIRFHGDAIHYLGLEAEVIRPVSLYQMRMERDVRPESA